MSWVGSVQTFTEHPWPKGDEKHPWPKGDEKHPWPKGDEKHPWPKGDGKSEENIAGTAPRAGAASEGTMAVLEEEMAALRAELKTKLEREKKDLERTRRETEALQAKLEKEKRELRKREYEAWPQSETVDRPMFPRLERPEQSAPTKVALAAEAPAAEVTTDTRVFPDTAAPDTSVEGAFAKLTSAAGPSSKISGGRRASTGTLVPLTVRYNNNNSSSSNNDTTTTCVVALLRPFDPGKGCQRDTRRGKAVIGLDLPFDRGKA